MGLQNYAQFPLLIIDLRFSWETQNPSEAIPWGFDSPSRHHITFCNYLKAIQLAAQRRYYSEQGIGNEVQIWVQCRSGLVSVVCRGTGVDLSCGCLYIYSQLRSTTECAADNRSAHALNLSRRQNTPLGIGNGIG